MTDSETIAEKLQSSTEGNRDLDLEVLNALGANRSWYWLDQRAETITCNRYGPDAIGNPVCGLERFTTSVDDALSLVPDGFDWLLANGITHKCEPPYGVQILRADGTGKNVIAEAESSSAPIAICIAALRARGTL